MTGSYPICSLFAGRAYLNKTDKRVNRHFGCNGRPYYPTPRETEASMEFLIHIVQGGNKTANQVTSVQAIASPRHIYNVLIFTKILRFFNYENRKTGCCLIASGFDTRAKCETRVPKTRYPSKYVDFSTDKLSLGRCIACFSL